MTESSIGPSHRPVIDEAILHIGDPNFDSLIEAMFRDQDTVGLILLLDALAGPAILSWGGTEDRTVEEVAEARDAYLAPAVKRLGHVCVQALRFRQRHVFAEGIERLAWIYDLGALQQLGATGGDSHLSWTVPSKHAITQFYVIGACAVFRRQLRGLQALLRLRAHKEPRRSTVLLLSHPHFHWPSGEGDSRAYFSDAKHCVVDNPSLYGLFAHSAPNVVDALCQFDFVVALASWMEGERSLPNYANYPVYHVSPVIEQMSDADICRRLLGVHGCQLLADFIRLVSGVTDQRRAASNMWTPTEWTDPIRQFIKKHPLREEGTLP